MNIHSKVKLRSGRHMPILGLGTRELNPDSAEVISEALDMGYPMIDAYRDYAIENGLAEGIRSSGRSRSDFYLITKVEEIGDAYDSLVRDLAGTNQEYADLTLIHHPPGAGVGSRTWQSLIRAKHDGLTKDIGVSNYSVDQIKHLANITGEIPLINQIEWSPFGYSKEMYDFCQANNIIIQAYSPLTRGERLNDLVLNEIADHYNKTAPQVLIRWNFQHGVVPIFKASNIHHLLEDLDVFDFNIARQDMMILDDLNEEYSSFSFSSPVYMR